MKGRAPLLILSLAALIVVLTGAGVLAWAMTHPTKATTAAAAAQAGQRPARLRVADLMTRAACTGTVIGTQLFSYETGRCHLGAAEVTIAVFDTDALRDQWVSAAQSYGGTFVTGNLWAAMVDHPDKAAAVAQALGGVVI